MVFFIEFKDKTFDVRLSTDGFRLNVKGTKKWQYVSEKDIKKLCDVLNATGKLKLSLKYNERSGFDFRNEFSIIRNSALICHILFPDFIQIENGYVTLKERIPFTHKFYLEARNKSVNVALDKIRTYIVSDKKLTILDKNQRKIDVFI